MKAYSVNRNLPLNSKPVYSRIKGKEEQHKFYCNLGISKKVKQKPYIAFENKSTSNEFDICNSYGNVSMIAVTEEYKNILFIHRVSMLNQSICFMCRTRLVRKWIN